MNAKMRSDALESISAHALCTGPRGPYETWIDSARGQRISLRQESDRGVFHAVTDGEIAWTIDEETGDTELGDASLVHAVKNHDFQMLVVEPIRATDARFDATGRLVGFSTTDSRDESAAIDVELHEWREVEGVTLPVLVVVHAVEGAFRLAFDDIRVNTVDERVFATPGSSPDETRTPTST